MHLQLRVDDAVRGVAHVDDVDGGGAWRSATQRRGEAGRERRDLGGDRGSRGPGVVDGSERAGGPGTGEAVDGGTGRGSHPVLPHAQGDRDGHGGDHHQDAEDGRDDRPGPSPRHRSTSACSCPGAPVRGAVDATQRDAPSANPGAHRGDDARRWAHAGTEP